MFEKKLYAGWGDMDLNSHMRNTAFLDKSADVRMMYFAEHGFPIEEFHRRRFGPVIRRDELEYFREIRLMEEMRVTLMSAGLSEDGSRFIVRNEFRRADGELAATVTSHGGWLDQVKRKLVAPPDGLLAAMRALSRVEGFRELPSAIRLEAD
jgi:acyl-CoA thioester hydrolase